ncbi:PEP-CTERM/exosortase system-associated acyltransferase [Salinicola lusitanus]|uniref:PEP-CTERM/exosortase system-associated acyltransferase n=1 Tax=Salinicola lusitanus TaxID=1949085 RepID=UPI0013009B9E|nr:PEP-CTERM/exosortase system-associated acyltransferase [Salinicola lusitanus]
MENEFFDLFNVVFAASESDRSRVFSLRHKVYCEELGYEPIDAKNRIERDEFDGRSLHCLVEHRATGLSAGCMRIVFPDDRNQNGYGLPIVEHCREHGVEIKLDSSVRSAELCEISRVAIPSYFRSGRVEDTAVDGFGEFVFSQQERRFFPMIGVSLFLCATAFTGLIERFHVLAMMENRFQRLLARSGIRFSQVSQPIHFRGERAAFYIDQRYAESGMRDSILPLYRSIQKDLSRQIMEKGNVPSILGTETLCKILN